jgi:hypothetical protein
MSPRWVSTPRLTDRLTVGRNVTLTLKPLAFDSHESCEQASHSCSSAFVVQLFWTVQKYVRLGSTV